MNKVLFLFFLQIVCVVHVTAQAKIDSLEALMPWKNREQFADLTQALSIEYSDVDNDKALKFGRDALTAALKLNDTSRIVRAARIKAAAYRRFDFLDSSTMLLNRFLPMAKGRGYEYEYRFYIMGLAVSYMHSGQYDQALDYFLQSLTLATEANHISLISAALNNIGLIYYKLGNIEKALGYYKQREKMMVIDDVTSTFNNVVIFQNLSLCFSRLGDFKNAKLYLDKAYALGKDNENILPEYFFDIGVFYECQNMMDSARWYYHKSLDISNKLGDPIKAQQCLLELAEDSRKSNRLFETKRYLLECEQMSKNYSRGNQEMLWLYEQYIKLLHELNDNVGLAQYQAKYIQLKDSIYDQRFFNNLARIESEYLERAKNKTIDEQTQMLKLKEEALSKQKTLTILTSTIVILFAILSILLFRNFRAKQRANLLLDQKVEERTRQILQSHARFNQRDQEEKYAIEKKVKDIKQSLTTVQGLCRIASSNDTPMESAKKCLAKIEGLADDIFNSVLSLEKISTNE